MCVACVVQRHVLDVVDVRAALDSTTATTINEGVVIAIVVTLAVLVVALAILIFVIVRRRRRMYERR